MFIVLSKICDYFSGRVFKAVDAANSWVKEGEKYNGGPIDSTLVSTVNDLYLTGTAYVVKVGHYTQMIWSRTTKVGSIHY